MPFEDRRVDSVQASERDVDRHPVVGAGGVELVLERQPQVAVFPHLWICLGIGGGNSLVDQDLLAEVEKVWLLGPPVAPPAIEPAHVGDVVRDAFGKPSHEGVVVDEQVGTALAGLDGEHVVDLLLVVGDECVGGIPVAGDEGVPDEQLVGNGGVEPPVLDDSIYLQRHAV